MSTFQVNYRAVGGEGEGVETTGCDGRDLLVTEKCHFNGFIVGDVVLSHPQLPTVTRSKYVDSHQGKSVT